MIHVARNNIQQGPHSLDEIHSLLASGQLSATDLAWKEGMAEWKPLRTIPGVSAPDAPTPPPALSNPAPIGNLYASPDRMAGAAIGAPINSGMAIASLVLGILCILLFFTHIFAVIMAILAVIFGHVSRGNIRRSNGQITGGGMALTGLILGYVGMLIIAVIVAIVALFFSKVADEASGFENLMRTEMKQPEQQFPKQQP